MGVSGAVLVLHAVFTTTELNRLHKCRVSMGSNVNKLDPDYLTSRLASVYCILIRNKVEFFPFRNKSVRLTQLTRSVLWVGASVVL
jgi:hypothetical protein